MNDQEIKNILGKGNHITVLPLILRNTLSSKQATGLLTRSAPAKHSEVIRRNKTWPQR